MNKRQEKIIELITNNKIQTQTELADMLSECGFYSTQSTVSRDISTLGLIKSTSNGTTFYTMPNGGAEVEDKYKKIFKESVISVKNSGNIIVIKTIAGSASAACAMLDKFFEKQLLGSVAGDDAIISVADSEHTAKKIMAELQNIVK